YRPRRACRDSRGAPLAVGYYRHRQMHRDDRHVEHHAPLREARQMHEHQPHQGDDRNDRRQRAPGAASTRGTTAHEPCGCGGEQQWREHGEIEIAPHVWSMLGCRARQQQG
ncbi:MAG: hypothetical protein ACK55I_42560, partial [bacterium]